MDVKLYSMQISHPSMAARKMLELKGVDYELVDVLPLNQRAHLRLAGFRGGTVPALKLDGRRIQGSTEISRALDAQSPSAPLFPSDPAQRARVEEAERWGDQQFQPVPRRLARYGALNSFELRKWAAATQGLPAPWLVAHATTPLIAYYARAREPDGRIGNEDGIRADLAALPGLLDHADELLADGTVSAEAPNAAALQILSTVRVLCAFADLQEVMAARECARAARQLYPKYPGPAPAFLPREWLP
jgi:glutathione S-transferase